MSIGKVEIDEAGFSLVDVRVGFNESKYQDLLDDLAEIDQRTDPVVHIQPNKRWLAEYKTNKASRAKRFLSTIAALYYSDGHYEYKDRSVWLKANKKIGETNRALVHETVHWADDVNGIYDYAKWYRIYQGLTVAGLTTGATAGFSLSE